MPSFESSRPAVVPAPAVAPWRLLRWLPFVAAAMFSLVMSAQAPDGRHAVSIDWNLSRHAIAFSLAKAPHIGAAAMLAWLGVMAGGRRHWTLVFVLTVVVGAGWELCQSTVVGRSARLADLAPDGLGALLGCACGAVTLWAVGGSRRQPLRR